MTKHSTCEISVVLPAFQEEENLRLLIPRLITVMNDIGKTYEILVIDTMCPLDDTNGVCKVHNCTYIARIGGNSFGDAIRTGISNAQGKYIVFMDADGSHAPEFIEKLYTHHSNTDIVIASRYIENGYTENNKILTLMSRTLNLTYRLVLGVKCHDLSNSFRLYEASQLKKLTLQCSNFDIVEEIILKLARNNKNLDIF
jgi:dolichol-phosphate mannosyltransferase